EVTDSRTSTAPKMAIGTPSRRTATVTAAIVAVRTRRRSSALPGLEPEAHAAHGRDVARRVGVVAQLATQPRDVHVERLRGPARGGRPHLAHQRLARHARAGLADQHAQQLELLRGE